MGLEALRLVVILEAVVGLGTVMALVAGSCLVSARRLDAARHVGRLVDAIAATEQGTFDQGQCVRLLMRTPRRLQLSAIARVSDQVRGPTAVRVAAIARAAGVTARAERWSRSRRWPRRLRGARALLRLDADRATILRLLDDPRAEVRAVAARCAAAHADPSVVDRLVGMLDDPAPDCRFAAKDALTRVGYLATGPLVAYLATATGVRAGTALEIARAVASPALFDVGRHLCRDDDALVRSRAARLVAATGDRRAVDVLRDLLTDPDPEVREAAVSGLALVRHLESAPALVRALNDPAFDVRRAAALALRSFGPRGRLYLRRASRNDDAIAADMARQVLELPETGAAMWTR
ncbi:HEAT repeat domain-containing protein [Knoellia locipacati]|uniref:HEAT repeat domain-containing protein n=1 Tax=Knoellia locipacati TaxID=882824 RepID=UPI00384ACFD9